MKIGIVGMGSIGTRHARVLAELGEHDVVALRSGLGARRELPPDLSHVQQCRDDEAFWGLPLDAVVIANPTSLHTEPLRRAVAQGLPAFVEKPLAAEVGELPNLTDAERKRVIVGFCLRFHPLVRAVRAFLIGDGGGLGRLLKARLYFGNYLPNWHPTSDYRTSYAARRALGGGVLLTVSHEIDLAQHLFGRIEVTGGDLGRVSDLEIDVDDVALVVFHTKDRGVGLVELDYLNPTPTRVGSLIGTLGRLDYTFSPPSAQFVGHDRSVVDVFSDQAVGSDVMYLEQMRDFVGFVGGRSSLACTYEDGLEVMHAISAVTRLVAQREKAHP